MSQRVEKVRRPNEVTDSIVATYRMLLRGSEEVLCGEDLTRPQFQALRYIAEKGATPMKGISDKMFVTPANITGIIDRLEAKGLVKRATHHGDRRAVIVELTARGAAVQERVSSKYKDFIQNALKVFTTEEQKTLRDLLLKLQEGMS